MEEGADMKRRILAILLVVSLIGSGTNCVWAENIGVDTGAENVEELSEEDSLETKDGENKQEEEKQTEEKREEDSLKESEQTEEKPEGENDSSDLKEEEETNPGSGKNEDNMEEDSGSDKDENNIETDDGNATNELAMQKSMTQEEQKIDSSQEETPRNAQSADGTFTEGLVTYQVNDDQTTCTIVEADRTRTDAIVIPEKVRGYKVTVVGKMAFDGCKFKTIQLPDGLLKIEYSAFQNSELENISIPDTVTEIGFNAFLECQNLVSVKLPAGLKEISSQMFRYDEKLRNVNVPEGVEKIKFSAFEECSGLVEISLPDSIKEIESYAFLMCVNLQKIKLPKYLEKINNETFRNCENLKNVIWPDKLKAVGDSAFASCYSLNTKIPEGIQKIGGGSFSETGIAELTIPESVMEIDTRAFQGCKQLKIVKMGSGIKTMKDSVFSSCDELEMVMLSNKTEMIGWGAFYNCPSLKKIFIPKSVTRIENEAFNFDSKLEYLYYEGNKDDWGKIEIGEYNDSLLAETTKILYNQNQLSNDEKEWNYKVNDDGKTCILYGRSSKASAASYENIVIDTIDGYTVTEIGDNAFYYDEKIKSVTLSKNIKYVGENAFGECKNLEKLTLLSKNTAFGMDSFAISADRNIKDIYYAGSVNDRKKYYGSSYSVGYSSARWHYQSDDNVSFQYEYQVNEDGKTCKITQADPLIYGKVEVPEKMDDYTVTEIGENAFQHCYSIEQLVLPDSIKKIGRYAFDECFALEKITFSKNLEVIGGSAFGLCESLKQIVIPDSVVEIGEQAFSNCKNLEKVTLPSGLKKLNRYAFDCGENLKEIVLPDSLEEMSECCISGSFKELTIPGKIKIIPKDALFFCEIDRLTISEGVEEIEKNAVRPAMDGGMVKAISLPKSIKKISEDAIGTNDLYVYYAGSQNDRAKINNMDSLVDKASWIYKTNTVPEYNYNLNPDGKTVTIISSNIDIQSKIVLPDLIHGYKVTAIGDNFLNMQEKIRQVIFPKYLESIGEGAFGWCNNLNTVQFPKSLKYIGTYAFDVTSLSSIRYNGSKSDREKMELPAQEDNPLNLVEWIYNYDKSDVKPKPTTSPVPTSTPKPTTTPDSGSGGSSGGTAGETTGQGTISGAKIGGRAADALRISWDKNKKAEGYIIEQKKNGTWTRIARIADANTTTYRISGLSAATTYEFRIRIFYFEGSEAKYGKNCNVSGKTNPSTISGLKIGGTAVDELRLNWNKNNSAQGYIIEQSQAGVWKRIARIEGNATVTFRVEKLSDNVTYNFRIQSFSFDGNIPLYSEWKNISGKTQKKNPNAVKEFKIGGRADNALRLNWKQEKTAEGYIIEQYQAGNWTRIARLEGNNTSTYRVEKLNPSREYKFRICAFAFDGSRPIYSTYSTMNGKTNPSKVEEVKIGGTAVNALRINWKQNETAMGYIIEKKEGNSWKRLARIEGKNVTTYRAENLKSNTTYEFRMQAFGFENNTPLYGEWNYVSGLTDADNVVPGSVTGLKVAGRAADAIRLNWDKNRTARGYIIEQNKSGKWIRIVRLEGNYTTTYRVEKLAASAACQYRVQAFNFKNGLPVYSSWKYISAKTLPAMTSGFRIGSAGKDSVQLSWNKNASASGYIIEQQKAGKWVRIARIEGNEITKYDVKNLQKATTYTFRIQAFGFDGNTPLYSSTSVTFGSTKTQ